MKNKTKRIKLTKIRKTLISTGEWECHARITIVNFITKDHFNIEVFSDEGTTITTDKSL